MTSRAISYPSRRPKPFLGSARLRRAGWVALALVLSAAAGVLTEAAPTALCGLFGLVIGTAIFGAYPVLALTVIVLLRGSIDSSTESFDIAGFTLAGLMHAGIALAGGLALLLSAPRLPAKRLTIPFLILLALAAVSIMYSPLPKRALTTWMALASVLVLFCMAAVYIRRPEHVRRIAWLLVTASVIPIAVGVIAVATGDTVTRIGGFESVQGTFEFSNGYAFFLLISLTVTLVLLLEERRPAAKALLGVALTLGSLCFFLTYTRSAWVAAIVVLALLATIQFRRLVLLGAIGVALVVLAFPGVLGEIQSRFEDLQGDSLQADRNSFSWRMDNWTRMLPYAQEKPFAGHGLGAYPALTYREFGTSSRNFAHIDGAENGVFAHNDFLALAVELGVAGPVLWLAVLLGMAMLAWRARAVTEIRPYASASFAITAVLIPLSAVDNVQSYTPVLLYAFVFAGAVAGAAWHSRAATERERQPAEPAAPREGARQLAAGRV